MRGYQQCVCVGGWGRCMHRARYGAQDTGLQDARPRTTHTTRVIHSHRVLFLHYFNLFSRHQSTPSAAFCARKTHLHLWRHTAAWKLQLPVQPPEHIKGETLNLREALHGRSAAVVHHKECASAMRTCTCMHAQCRLPAAVGLALDDRQAHLCGCRPTVWEV